MVGLPTGTKDNTTLMYMSPPRTATSRRINQQDGKDLTVCAV